MTMNRNTVALDRARATLGARLKKAREGMHLNAAELGRRADVSAAVITNIESGQTVMPSAESVYKLTKYMAIRASWLLFDDGPMRRMEKGPEVREITREVYVDRIPVAMTNTLARITEEMQFSQVFCPDSLDSGHVNRWLKALLALPQLAVLNDNVTHMPRQAQPHLVGASDNADASMSGADMGAEPGAEGSVAPERLIKLPPPPKGLRPLTGYRPGNYAEKNLRGGPRKDGLMRRREICVAAGISDPTFMRWQAEDPAFPKPANQKEIDERNAFPAYDRKEVERWIAARMTQPKEKHRRKA